MSKHTPARREVSGGLSGELPSPRVNGEDFNLVMAMRSFIGKPTGTAIITSSTIIGAVAGFSSGLTPPSGPSIGDRWWKTDVGAEFTYIDDGSSQQWVEI